jgi:hypothetical protein
MSKKRQQEAGKKAAIRAIGGPHALARALSRDLTGQAVTKWNRISDLYLMEVEQITGVPRDKLRPDLFEGYVKETEKAGC